MAPNGHLESRVIPAQLSFLSIYSPALGPTDETFRDQIVFYYSRAQKEASHASKKGTTPKIIDSELREEENERLRQIGLAQGMVGFAQSFSDGQNVDSVETEKSRIVLHELERGWWILASIDLTRLPASSNASKGAAADEDGVEYSAREVSPPSLLIEQLLTAHRIFLLHHGPSLQDLFEKIKRDRFCSIVERYWSSFCKDWEVLLHGNPAVDVFGGVKLAAGGELGMGVGEEEWGSGERAVLEDLTRETEGLVDLTVSRFGKSELERHHEETEEQRSDRENTGLPWLGLARAPEAYDGLIFGGVGALSRHSLRDVSNWIAQIYSRGEYAYGVKDNPHRTRRKRPRRALPSADSQATVSGAAGLRKQLHKPDIPLPDDPRPALHERVASYDHAPGSPSVENPAPLEVNMRSGIPPPIVSAVESSLDKASSGAQKTQPQTSNGNDANHSTFGISNDRWVKYLTFGLGGGKTSNEDASLKERPNASRETSATSAKTLRQQDIDQKSRISKEAEEPQLQEVDPMPDGYEIEARLADQRRQETDGYFLIGLKKDLSKAPSGDSPADEELDEDEGDRLLLRTLQVEIVKKQNYEKQVDNALGRIDSQSDGDDDDEDTEISSFRRLRVVVYVRRPFIYTFLFEQRTPALQMSAFYKDIHQHLKPLHKPLQSSTAIANIARRIADSHTSSPEPSSINSTNPPYQAPRTSPVFDLVYDPMLLTVHTSIPNIPLPGTPAAEGISTTSSGKDGPPQWTRIEGLNVHSQILNTLDSTKRLESELERTSKTSRGWWVVWLRIPPFSGDKDEDGKKQYSAADCKIAFLVRRASDWYQSKGASSGMFNGSRVASGMFGLGSKNETTGVGGSDANGWGPASLASGIGIDARKYVEGLLSLNR